MAFGIDDAVAAGLKIVDKFIPDPVEKIKAEAALRDALLAADAKQAEVNAAEAANPNFWVSGARPAFLWICAVGFAWHYILFPVLFFLGSIFHVTGMPEKSGIDGGLFELAFGLLGLAGMRTYEKVKGVARI